MCGVCLCVCVCAWLPFPLSVVYGFEVDETDRSYLAPWGLTRVCCAKHVFLLGVGVAFLGFQSAPAFFFAVTPNPLFARLLLASFFFSFYLEYIGLPLARRRKEGTFVGTY